MTAKQTEIAKAMMNCVETARLSLTRYSRRFYLLNSGTDMFVVNQSTAKSMVLRGLVVPAGEDDYWDYYRLSDKTAAELLEMTQTS